jgi:hypothetical protein
MFWIIIFSAGAFVGAVGTSVAVRRQRFWWLAITIPLLLMPVALYVAILISCRSGNPCP